MVYSSERRSIVDCLGNHQHLAVDIGIIGIDLRIQVNVRNYRRGPLFGDRSRFQVEWINDPEISADILPGRVEARE